jgi:hypothetical protein
MKKAIFLVVLTLLGANVIYAQGETSSSSVSWGVAAGVNFSGVMGDDVDNVDSRTGLYVGGVVNIGISELFSVQPEVKYSMRGWKDGEFTIKIDYVDIPVMADFEVVDGLSLQGGPLIGINLSAKVEDDDGDETDIDNISTLNAGIAIGAQYELPVGVFFNIRYDMGFNDVIDNNFSAKNCNLGGGVGFFF